MLTETICLFTLYLNKLKLLLA
uniref:Uncharacterized protein n=1 Tax=Anopheles atroparvus TaxID=41427 RepID=A0AAG5DV28_ANOAO